MKVVKYAENLIIKKDITSIILDCNLVSELYKVLDREKESGGVFYGYKLSGIEEYRICGFTCPFKKDITSKSTYKRLDSKHIEHIKNIWSIDKSIMYLGDWHSHPSQLARSSKTDEETWKNISLNARTNSSILIFAIISYAEIMIIAYNKKGDEILKSILSINGREIHLSGENLLLNL